MKTAKYFAAVILGMMFFTPSGALGASAISDYLAALREEPTPEEGREYYMRNCIWHEDGVSKTTAYARGELVPINTKVTLKALYGDMMSIRINSTGKVVKIENVIEFSRRYMHTIARNMLSPVEVTFEGIPKESAEAIKRGELQLGMTKQQVLMTRGWPPGHKTPSLDADTWYYWASKLVLHTLVFEDGKLAKARGVR